MSAIETIPKALAQDGESTTEEQFLGAAKERRMARQVTAEHPGPSNESPDGRQAGGLMRTWRAVWTSPFRALRELYWLLDPDAKVRSKGLQIMGHVVATETTTETRRGESGEETYTTYHVTYQFVAYGSAHTDRKHVGSLAKLGRGAAIRVYYLPETYPLKSAIDWEPGKVKHG